MRREWRWVAWSLGCALWAGCSNGDSGAIAIDPGDVHEVDFIGELVAADTSQWEQTQRAPNVDPIAETPGGPDSQLLVGPATLTLDDGTVVAVATHTPGGTLCQGLGDRQACIVMGAFEPATTTAEWFAAEIVDRHPNGGYRFNASFIEGRAVLSAGWNAYYTVPVPPDVIVGCGLSLTDVLDKPTAGYSVTLTPEYEVIAIECFPDYSARQPVGTACRTGSAELPFGARCSAAPSALAS